MDQITVSFILPVHNVEPYLSQCLESVFAQSLKNYEIILLNDGSTDGSLALCREYESKYENVRVLDQPNSGVSVTRNNGIAMARGKYICFLDADDYYVEDFAKDFYEICEREQLDVIRGLYGAYEEDRGEFVTNPLKPLSYYDRVLSGKEFLVLSMKEYANEVVPWLGFFRREYLVENNLLFPKGIAYQEDQIFFLEALVKQSCRIMQKPTVFYAYRQRAGSATSTPTLKKAEDVAFIVSQELQLAKSLPDPMVRRAAKRFAGSSFFQMTCIYGRVPKEQRKAIRRLSSFQTKWSCIWNAANRYQQIKTALFTFAPWVLDAYYAKVFNKRVA